MLLAYTVMSSNTKVRPVTMPTAATTVYTPVSTGRPAATTLPNTKSRIINVSGAEINSASTNSSLSVKSKVTSIARLSVTHFSIPSGESAGSRMSSMTSFRSTFDSSRSRLTSTLIRDHDGSTELISLERFASFVSQGYSRETSSLSSKTATVDSIASFTSSSLDSAPGWWNST